MKTMAAGSFKGYCLAVMDEVQAKREAIVITKHGKPVVKLVPAEKDAGDIYGFLAGKGAVIGDAVSPAISSGEWGELKRFSWIRRLWCGWHSTRIGSRKRREQRSTMPARVERASPCDITLLELASLFRKGRIRLEISLESFLDEVEARFVVLPTRGRACARALGLLGLPADYPKDPGDRIIGATALVGGMSLLTADREIRKAQAVRTIW